MKEHPAKPMTVDQALFEMELVGHDFYLFSDADTGRPSVVYRRHAYDYGLIRLSTSFFAGERIGVWPARFARGRPPLRSPERESASGPLASLGAVRRFAPQARWRSRGRRLFARALIAWWSANGGHRIGGHRIGRQFSAIVRVDEDEAGLVEKVPFGLRIRRSREPSGSKPAVGRRPQ